MSVRVIAPACAMLILTGCAGSHVAVTSSTETPIDLAKRLTVAMSYGGNKIAVARTNDSAVRDNGSYLTYQQNFMPAAGDYPVIVAFRQLCQAKGAIWSENGCLSDDRHPIFLVSMDVAGSATPVPSQPAIAEYILTVDQRKDGEITALDGKRAGELLAIKKDNDNARAKLAAFETETLARRDHLMRLLEETGPTTGAISDILNYCSTFTRANYPSSQEPGMALCLANRGMPISDANELAAALYGPSRGTVNSAIDALGITVRQIEE